MLQTKLKPAYVLSAIIAILAVVASAGGLFISEHASGQHVRHHA